MPPHGLAKVVNAEIPPRIREAAAQRPYLSKKRLDPAPDGLKTAPHHAAGEISGLGQFRGEDDHEGRGTPLPHDWPARTGVGRDHRPDDAAAACLRRARLAIVEQAALRLLLR